MMKYLFDTNIFNEILDGSINTDNFKDNIICYTTHIQHDEINSTKNKVRREALNSKFSVINDERILTESFVLDVSRFDNSKYSDGVLYEDIKQSLDKLNKKKKNNERDALIAEVSIKNNLTLVTHDMELYKAVTKFKGAAVNLFYLLKTQSNN
ncbi:PIN domain-containing protein [Sulfurimonas sp.]|uniref:PIN domain-containing protein n=1 Tax=Sulfurimonas sp. TaxID=2022749 RepID=UPI0035684A85